ncbi:helix-turn-helix transcriptional regulator [Flavobacterium sp.]|uniref:helix-turn-helix transcriptional regulator n=1 Tax=Flavobacterium sp. TaxID=239 RepID=UPI00374C89B4
MNIVVGNKLKELRKIKNLSQEQVADYLCISQSAYARIESGESHSWASHILKICTIFEITPEELFHLDGQKNISSGETIYQLSEDIIEQYEEKIKELRKVIKDLKKRGKV